ncbi:hypothetical protein A2645_01005 [Candidatus Nomurabacteria bacterium RIFCSPHIGHO2_01_FULL_39_9]|uniref:Uncharacterized protein n=1 Tax=Candidatus Nomurabacteria bacterium RIFCSPHIGHO2_01_FULL_39_9 TaxID=1801735 RepID=A0A1F6UWP1_9BACT|nr:MAG: hypothetical protein A2645_01005 [Candidatus Nomurabacteria bacterium RIFCSPHIGHO2_01_FULL_39_9]
MTTKELIDYIKGEFKEGTAREKITGDLTSFGGWTKEDVSEAFSVIDKETAAPPPPPPPPPVPPVAPPPPPIITPTPGPSFYAPKPVSPPPIPSMQPRPIPPPPPAPKPAPPPPPPSFPPMPLTSKAVMTPTPTPPPPPVIASIPTGASFVMPMGKSSKMIGIIGAIAVVASLIISYFPLVKLLETEGMIKIAIVLAVLNLIPILTLQFLTRKILEHSWGKALFVVGVPGIVVALFSFASKSLGLTPIIGGVVSFGFVIAWLFFFAKVYKTGLWKAFKVGFLQILLNTIIIAALILVIGFTFLEGLTTNISDISNQTNFIEQTEPLEELPVENILLNYTNSELNFSFDYPQDFSWAQEPSVVFGEKGKIFGGTLTGFDPSLQMFVGASTADFRGPIELNANEVSKYPTEAELASLFERGYRNETRVNAKGEEYILIFGQPETDMPYISEGQAVAIFKLKSSTDFKALGFMLVGGDLNVFLNIMNSVSIE